MSTITDAFDREHARVSVLAGIAAALVTAGVVFAAARTTLALGQLLAVGLAVVGGAGAIRIAKGTATVSTIEKREQMEVGCGGMTIERRQAVSIPMTRDRALLLGVAAGLAAAAAVFEYLDVAVTDRLDDGERVASGDVALRVEGEATSILRGERVAVNVAAHASGVATKTGRAVEAAREAVRDGDGGDGATEGGDEPPRIAATRKTTPGLRGVEKRAVAAAGGDTHRLNLSHMAIVKDNHVAELGLEAAVERVRERTSFATRVEVEAETIGEARRAAAAGADVVLLDNMSPDRTREAVDAVGDREALVEASGGIAVGDVPAYATTGVDVISMGSLTHSAPALDYSFRTG